MASHQGGLVRRLTGEVHGLPAGISRDGLSPHVGPGSGGCVRFSRKATRVKEIRIPQDGWGRIGLPIMDCGHPLAARQIVSEDGLLVTRCWACAVQRDVVSKIVGPAAKRAGKHRDIGAE